MPVAPAMIDVDALEDQLERALAANLGFLPVAEPPPSFRARSRSPQSPQRAQKEEVGPPTYRWDASASPIGGALFEGRVDDARAGLADALRRRRQDGDPEAEARLFAQRFWLVLEWGDEDEQYGLLDECRRRAYTHGEVVWRGALTVLLAHLGRRDEAVRDLEATVAECEALAPTACWLDVVTNLAEAAFLLGDVERARTLHKWLANLPDQLVVVGPGDVCKGSLRRFQAHVAAVVGASADADEGFRSAADAHRALGARPLLARTLHQWGRSLAGRDDLLARRCLQEAEDLTDELGLPGRAGTAGPRGDCPVSTPA
ncbi:MAG TPA: hypothetical protein VHF24_14895 [Acidimicrobiales bacterium]|nr:hypothetical protein [Acidimicrobiales bacterium]